MVQREAAAWRGSVVLAEELRLLAKNGGYLGP